MRAWLPIIAGVLSMLQAGCVEAPVPVVDDADIISVVLDDLASREDNMLLDEGMLLIAPESSAIDADVGLPYERVSAQCRPATSLHAELMARNAVVANIAPSIAASSKWRIATDRELDTPLYMQHETARSIIRLKLPAVSADRLDALIMLSFLWSQHGAEATYLLRREHVAWRIICSDLFFYP